MSGRPLEPILSLPQCSNDQDRVVEVSVLVPRKRRHTGGREAAKGTVLCVNKLRLQKVATPDDHRKPTRRRFYKSLSLVASLVGEMPFSLPLPPSLSLSGCIRGKLYRGWRGRVLV